MENVSNMLKTTFDSAAQQFLQGRELLGNQSDNVALSNTQFTPVWGPLSNPSVIIWEPIGDQWHGSYSAKIAPFIIIFFNGSAHNITEYQFRCHQDVQK